MTLLVSRTLVDRPRVISKKFIAGTILLPLRSSVRAKYYNYDTTLGGTVGLDIGSK